MLCSTDLIKMQIFATLTVAEAGVSDVASSIFTFKQFCFVLQKQTMIMFSYFEAMPLANNSRQGFTPTSVCLSLAV